MKRRARGRRRAATTVVHPNPISRGEYARVCVNYSALARDVHDFVHGLRARVLPTLLIPSDSLPPLWQVLDELDNFVRAHDVRMQQLEMALNTAARRLDAAAADPSAEIVALRARVALLERFEEAWQHARAVVAVVLGLKGA
jgi:hypothetical protein